MKVYTKYDSSYVNYLYTQLNEHFYKPFTFHCITDDPIGIDSDITIIPFKPFTKVWWNKMILFDEERFPSGMFFDLDIVIQNDITYLYNPGEYMRFLYTYWYDVKTLRDVHTIGNYQRYCSINSSVLCWDVNTKRQHIYDYYIKNKDKIEFVFTGIDSYIEHRFKDDYILYDDVSSSFYREFDNTKDIILFEGLK